MVKVVSIPLLVVVTVVSCSDDEDRIGGIFKDDWDGVGSGRRSSGVSEGEGLGGRDIGGGIEEEGRGGTEEEGGGTEDEGGFEIELGGTELEPGGGGSELGGTGGSEEDGTGGSLVGGSTGGTPGSTGGMGGLVSPPSGGVSVCLGRSLISSPESRKDERSKG